MTYTKIKRRINITLPAETLRRLDRASERGERSRLIDEAVRLYLRELSRKQLHSALRAGAQARAERDHSLSREWFAIEHDV